MYPRLVGFHVFACIYMVGRVCPQKYKEKVRRLVQKVFSGLVDYNLYIVAAILPPRDQLLPSVKEYTKFLK